MNCLDQKISSLPTCFQISAPPLVGIELEMFLVDKKTFQLVDGYELIHRALPTEIQERVKEEHLTAQLEYASKPYLNVNDLFREVNHAIKIIQDVASTLGKRILFSSTHPFEAYRTELVTDSERTRQVVERFGKRANKLGTCGFHIHCPSWA